MLVSRSGEVDVSQFEPGQSAFAAALCKYMGAPESTPAGGPREVDQAADYWYGRFTGTIAAGNSAGMSLEQLHVMLNGLGLRWRNLPIGASSSHASDIEQAKASLGSGRPVSICGSESGFHDLELGGRVPYNWQPSGNHAIVASGIAS